MRRFVFFAVLLAISLPVGLSTTGCSADNGSNFCSGFQSGAQLNAPARLASSLLSMGSRSPTDKLRRCQRRLLSIAKVHPSS